MDENKKNISCGAKKAQSLTRAERGGEEKNTASKTELSNNKVTEEINNEKDVREAKMEARTAESQKRAAQRAADKERRLKERAEKKAEKSNRRRTPGFGGWLAAVISLGAACLVLATIVTYGWITMSGMQAGMAGMQTQSLYELNAIVDNLHSNLTKARVSSSPSDRARVLSDIAIESEMAEVVLERLPLDYTFTNEMAAFINKMGDSAQSMLYTVAAGGELEEWQKTSLEYMYRNNAKLKEALNDIVSGTGNADILDALRGKGSVLEGGFNDIKNNVIEEPKGIFDGPFSDNAEDTNMSFFERLREVSQGEAEEMARQLFADYSPTDVRCTGEVKKGGMEFYNISVSTEDGEMFAQLSKKGGKLVMFDSYKDCSEHNFSTELCEEIARKFLAAAGYENVEPVWMSENGTTCNINFCYVQDGVVIYPDMIKLKVCEERGIVTGAEAISFVKNHSQRDIGGATVSEAQARSSIDGRIDVTSSRLALIPSDGEEVLCYEFAGTYDGSDYFIYVDAATGEEIQVLTVIGTAQGRAVL